MASTSSHPELPATPAGRASEVRWIRAVPAIAFLLALAASVALLFIPYYGSIGVGDGATGTATLIEVNGSGVVLAVTLPVLLTGTIALVKGRRALLVSALCTLVLAAFVVLAVASIGMFYLPALLVAVVDVFGRTVVARLRTLTHHGRVRSP